MKHTEETVMKDKVNDNPSRTENVPPIEEQSNQTKKKEDVSQSTKDKLSASYLLTIQNNDSNIQEKLEHSYLDFPSVTEGKVEEKKRKTKNIVTTVINSQTKKDGKDSKSDVNKNEVDEVSISEARNRLMASKSRDRDKDIDKLLTANEGIQYYSGRVQHLEEKIQLQETDYKKKVDLVQIIEREKYSSLLCEKKALESDNSMLKELYNELENKHINLQRKYQNLEVELSLVRKWLQVNDRKEINKTYNNITISRPKEEDIEIRGALNDKEKKVNKTPTNKLPLSHFTLSPSPSEERLSINEKEKVHLQHKLKYLVRPANKKADSKPNPTGEINNIDYMKYIYRPKVSKNEFIYREKFTRGSHARKLSSTMAYPAEQFRRYEEYKTDALNINDRSSFIPEVKIEDARMIKNISPINQVFSEQPYAKDLTLGQGTEQNHRIAIGISEEGNLALKGEKEIENQAIPYAVSGDAILEKIHNVQEMNLKLLRKRYSLEDGNKVHGQSKAYSPPCGATQSDNLHIHSNSSINAKSLFLKPRRAPPPIPMEEQY